MAQLRQWPMLSSTEAPRLDAVVERDELQELALEHLDAIYRMALQMVRRPDDAADLVQETFLRALDRPAELPSRDPMEVRAWLLRLLRGTLYSKSQAPEASAETPMGDSTPDEVEEGLEPELGDRPGGLDVLNWDHVDGQLKTAVNRLQPEYRTVLLLWAVEGLKYREIAEVLSIPIGTVMSRLHRARAILGDQLAEWAKQTGRLGA